MQGAVTQRGSIRLSGRLARAPRYRARVGSGAGAGALSAMDCVVAPTYDSAMRSGATRSPAGTSSTPQRRGSPRTVLVVGAVILGLVVVAGFVHVVHGEDVEIEEAAPRRE